MSSPGSSKVMRTRHQSGSKLTQLVGPGKEFMPSEVPTLRAVIQRGLLIKERLQLEQGTVKTDIQASEISVELVPLIRAQWPRSNAKFSPPLNINDNSLRIKVVRMWKRVEEVVRGRATKAEVKKVEDLLDKLLDITTCKHTILLCDQVDSQCKEAKNCLVKAHIKCDCPKEIKVAVMELQWLAAQRAKIGEKSSMMMSNNDKVETERQRKAEKRKMDQLEADIKKKKKLEEEEKLLAEREEFHSELDMDVDIGEEKEQDALLPPSFTKDECKIKDKEKEVNVVVDCLLQEKLGDLAWAVVRYLGRPGLRRNTMPVVKTARASLR